MTERQEQMIYDEGYRRGKAERHKMLEDGTLVVDVDDATAVTRVLVEDNKNVNICNKADRPKGKWHHIQSVCYGGGTMKEVVCSKCHEHQILPTNFCPYCGADMRGEDDE